MGAVLTLAFFILILAMLTGAAVYHVRRSIAAENEAALQVYTDLQGRLNTIFTSLQTEVTAEPCTAQFRSQLRRLAYRPDGFSELIYAPGGIIQCSDGVGRLTYPIPLGIPDLTPQDGYASMVWIDSGLAFAGLGDLVGTIILRGDYAVIVPPLKRIEPTVDWLDLEVVLRGRGEHWWHRNGDVDVYRRNRIAAGERTGPAPAFRELVCSENAHHCVATEASLTNLVSSYRFQLIAAVMLAAGLAWRLSRAVQQFITRHWSFEARFRRNCGIDTIVCAYQPVMDLHSGRIIGCEVLARWRDVDGTVVFPDRFIPIIEDGGDTLGFTRDVATKAHRELSAVLPVDERLQLAFNVFPEDLGKPGLVDVFDVFAGSRDRFDVAVEIVESKAFDVADAECSIEALHGAGLKIYIDDFGSGYSNIRTLAALPIDGVKLDRAFAMAPDDSLMARMLNQAIDMIRVSGRVIVVEGVETAERLQALRGIQPAVDRVQGYHIARPMSAMSFAEFLYRQRHAPTLLAAA
ncbi:EAL domain-containing protein [Mangrovicella endophytica]|uniref:EAL domain-containing protein n=1 Tax=Mangrovicella endophytica TaxID=2066697 RepID=UPI0018E45083|nr:EAL domain-containing protein [Mangrovicella endophytica]